MGTGINNLSELIAWHAEMATLMNDYDTPTANPHLLARIKDLVLQMQSLDAYCYNCALRLETAAEHYYSDQKHKIYYFGAEECRAKMRDALRCISSRIAEIQATEANNTPDS